MPARDHPGDELAGGDHQVTAGHDPVIVPFEPGLLGIGAVIGCDERHTGPPRRDPGRPGRRPTAGMDDRYPLLPNDANDTAGIEQDVYRVLGRQRQADVTTSGPCYGRDHAPSRARNERTPATVANRLGHLDGPAFDAASIQVG